MNAGFTVTELMITTSIAGIIAAAASAFYLEGRVAGARIEAEVRLLREASLVSEVIARDLRGAEAAVNLERGIQIGRDEILETRPVAGPLGNGARAGGTPQPADRLIRYVVASDGLERHDGRDRSLVSRSMTRLEIADSAKSGWRVTLELARPLLRGRTVRVLRTIFVGRRK